AGAPYFELGYVRIIEVQKETGIAKPELSCADIVPGDLAVPFEEREAPRFRSVTLNGFAPHNGKTQGRIIMANDFDSSSAPGTRCISGSAQIKASRLEITCAPRGHTLTLTTILKLVCHSRPAPLRTRK